MITLGIETSCDETALAIIETKHTDGNVEYRVLGSLIHSQAALHSPYGGVYPNLAKREHAKNLMPLLKKLLEDSMVLLPSPKQTGESNFTQKISDIKNKYNEKNSDLVDSLVDIDFLKRIPAIDKIAVTEGPGLEPALWVGISFAQILSELWSIPVTPVNHMEGHIVGSLLDAEMDSQWKILKPIDFPALALLISGGHTELVKIESNGSTDAFPLKYKIIGQTKDDAVGEAFDKVARLLDLPYPGGPQISQLANEASVENGGQSDRAIKLPRPMLNSNDLNFSFSGLKTAVLYAVRKETEISGTISVDFKRQIAKEFEDSVNEVLCKKLRMAIEETGAKAVIVGGGVIANTRLRSSFTHLANEYGLTLYLPSKHISGDNALMIALAGALNGKDIEGQLKADGTKRLA